MRARAVRAAGKSACSTGIAKGWSARGADIETRGRAGAAEQQRDSSGEDSGQRGGSRRADYEGAVHAKSLRGLRGGVHQRHTGNAGWTRTFDLQRVVHGTGFQRTVTGPGERDAGAVQSAENSARGCEEQRNLADRDGLSGIGKGATFA